MHFQVGDGDKDPEDVRSWPRCRLLEPHAVAALAHAPDEGDAAEKTGRLLNQYALHLRARADYTEAEPLYRRSIRVDEASLGPEHPHVATDLNNLAQLLQRHEPARRGRAAHAARAWHRRTRLRPRSPERRHPPQQSGAAPPSHEPARRGRAAHAPRARHRRTQPTAPITRASPSASTIWRNSSKPPTGSPRPSRSCGARLPSTNTPTARITRTSPATSTIWRSCSKPRTGWPRPSRSCGARSPSTKHAYGPDHPNVAIRLNNLAGLLTRHQPARRGRAAHAPRARHRRNKPTAPITRASPDDLNNLARGSLQSHEPARRGRAAHAAARLAIDETRLGPDHPNVAIRLNNLAQLLKATNRLAEAEPLMRRALAIDENTLRPRSPERRHRPQQSGAAPPSHQPARRGRAADAARARYIHGEPWAGSSEYEDGGEELRAIT